MRKKKCCIICIFFFSIFCIQLYNDKLSFMVDGKLFEMKSIVDDNPQKKEVITEDTIYKATTSTNIRGIKRNKDIEIFPGGQPIGVKLSTEGVLVVGISEIKNEKGINSSPAVLAGINIGDTILKINNEKIVDAYDLAEKIDNSQGQSVEIKIQRNRKNFTKKIIPVKASKDSKFKIGLWVRDSTSGVGTLTFYDEKTGVYGALGHPITDIDTSTILDVGKGSIYSSTIVDCKKGEKGNPGELRGIFIEDEIMGSVNYNTNCGIYGYFNKKLKRKNIKPLKVAFKEEIVEGPAKILTTISGCDPKYYDIEIQKLLNQDEPGSKSMILKVTDEELLEKTGGIVQGMSGSPIIQNEKIIGAVTHVLINKPDVGYGIYIEWMIEEAGIQ
ncbi:SpoIVB peptidase [Clostridium sp. DL1XJH146]